MALNRRLWMIWLLMGLLAAVPLWGQNITLSCPGQIAAGVALSCSVNTSLGAGVTADALSFGMQVSPNGGAPALTSGFLKYTDIIGQTNAASASAQTNGTFDQVAVLYAGLNPLLDSTTPTAGTVRFALPASAAVGQTYTLALTGASAALNNVSVPITFGGAQTIAIIPPPLSISTASLPTATAGLPYSQTVQAAGGSLTYTNWAAAPLPAGLSINSATGAITGTPTNNTGSPVSTQVTVTVTDSATSTASKTYTLKVDPPLSISGPAALPVATGSAAYSVTTFAATGGSGTYSSWAASGLPTGLNMNSANGNITGTPTNNTGAAINAQVTVTVTDSVSATATKVYTLTVNSVLTVSTASLNVATSGTPYSVTLKAGGGSGTYTNWGTTALPAGLSIVAATGIISGTPTNNTGSPVSTQVTVTVTDSTSATASATYTLTVDPPLSISAPAVLPVATGGLGYTVSTFAATGGSGTYTNWAAAGLPAGLNMNSANGNITGTPTNNTGAAINAQVTVTVTDSVGATANKVYTLTIDPALTIATPATLTAATSGTSYTVSTFTATGGSGTYTNWAAPALPAGLSMNAANGNITGTPTNNTGSPVSTQVTVTVTDSASATASKVYTLTVDPPLSISAPATLTVATGSLGYSVTTFAATGGSGTYTNWAAAGLPAGLSMNAANGSITGTPTNNTGAPINAQVTVTVTDSVSATASKVYTLTVDPVLTISAPAALPVGTGSAAYSVSTFAATGGSGTYTNWAAAGLPGGLSMNSANGNITGTPTNNTGVAINAQVTVTVTDSTLATASKVYTLTVDAALTVATPATLLVATSGAGYTVNTFTATGGSGTYTNWAASGLPSGLSMNAANGNITGTPTNNTGSPVSTQVTVTVTDSASATANKVYTLTVDPTLSISAPAALTAATGSLGYSVTTFAATGGSGTYTNWAAAGLPAGLSMNAANGNITGTPTNNTGAAINAQVTVTVTDSVSATASKVYTLTINPVLSISAPATLPAGTVGNVYSQGLTATGGSGTYPTWGASVLPAGLSINTSTGLISGTPSNNAGSPFTVTVTVTDSNGATASKVYNNLVINGPLTISTPAPLPVATAGAVYSVTVKATGGSGTFTNWAAPALPQGLSIGANTGTISGTPVNNTGSPVNTQVTVTVTDSNSATASATYTLTVDPPLSISAPAALTVATGSAAYSVTTLAATGGSGTYTNWVAAGLPGGLTMNAANGNITGTPTNNTGAAINAQVTVTVTDSVLATANKVYTLTVDPALTVSAPATLLVATSGLAYSVTTLAATGGSGTYTNWAAAGLPAGLSMNPGNGNITGTPTNNTGSPVSTQVTVTVTDSASATANRVYTLTVDPPLSISAPATLTVATGSTAYSVTTFAATGGSGTYANWVAAGLPAGLNMNAANGNITGTPTNNTGAAINAQVTVTVTDSASATANKIYTLTVNPALVISTATPLPQGVLNLPYVGVTIAATGGSGTYTTWGATGLPAGLGINSATGAIAGTPTTNANSPYSVTVTVTDSNLVTASKTFTLTINGVLTVSAPATLPAGTAGVAYPATTVTATGGIGPYSWGSTTLPSGLSINSSTGVISGTPATSTGSPFSATVTVTDSTTTAASKLYSLTINPAPSVTGPAALPVGTVNAAYTSTTVTGTNGTGTLVWTAAGLPPGLSINAATGAIAGTPTANANSPYSVTVTVTDALGGTGNKIYSVTVNAALVITAPAALPLGIPGVVYPGTTPTATGGAAPYTWSVTGLPAGLNFATATGAITGTPSSSAGSPFNVQLTVTDSNLVKTTRGYTLAVAPPLSISGPASIPAGTAASAYPATTVVAVGGSTPYTWTATGLPAGMNIGAGTGTIGGSPGTSTGSPFSVQVTVTDANGSTAKISYSLTVSAIPLTINPPYSLPVGVVNLAYPQTVLAAQGGIGNYTWAATGLPPGMSIDSNSGAISGTPTTSTGSPFSVVVTVTDSNSVTASRTYPLTISGALTVASPASLPAATLGLPYPGPVLMPGGGAGPYNWTATGLPPGLRMVMATGVITGTPTTATGSPFNVVVTVTDSTGASANRSYILTVSSPLSLTGPLSLPVGTVNVAYASPAGTATGGVLPYSWSATNLPAGLSIASATGVISGTPANIVGSPYNVQLTVTDNLGSTSSLSYLLTVNAVAQNTPVVITSVSNAASGLPLVAPNTWVSIYGSNFEPAGFTDTWSKSIVNGQLPIQLDGVSATVGGQTTYAYYVSPGQVNVLLPNVGFGPLQVTVTAGAGTSNAVTVTSQPDSPAFFPWPANQPVATHLDYTLAAKDGTLGATTIPAKPGETIVLWGTGFGPTIPAAPVGTPVPASPLYLTATPVTVTIGGSPAAVSGTALASGNAGLYQIGVTIPANLTNGDYAVLASINGVQTLPLTLTIHN